MKTAVEKLELSILGLISFDSEELRAKYKEKVSKAKELEKQQIINAFEDGIVGNFDPDNFSGHDAKNYYKETFNK